MLRRDWEASFSVRTECSSHLKPKMEKGEILMQKMTKIAAFLVLCMLLIIPMFININVSAQPPATLIVEAPPEPIPAESFFDVYIHIDSFFDVFYYGVVLGYDTRIIDAVDAMACPPFETASKTIGEEAGLIILEGIGGPVFGIAKLAVYRFQCTGAGVSPLTILDAFLMDSTGMPIPIGGVINGEVTQTTWYFKASYPDYAPSGVPDFDQKQLPHWTNPWPPVGTWSYCGPVAVANSLWWLDSEHEPNPIPPPAINDGFPLVQSYAPGVWDDHDPQNVQPLVDDLAFLMNTNGIRYGTPMLCGTEVHDMANGLIEYIQRQGLDWKFYVHLEKSPDFFWIEDEIKRCQDVVLLLGFWQLDPTGYWIRLGGHYVTCAGVDSTNMMLAISDPFVDMAEMGMPGRVIPPPPHPHTGIPETLHNDAQYVSHDFYPIGGSPSPGGPFGFYEYPAEYVIDNFGSCQNIPIEFIEFDGEYIPGEPIFTEIEYAVVTSCKTGIVAAGSEDTNIYVWDFAGTLQWQFALGNPVVSVAMDSNGRFIAAGTRSPLAPTTGSLWLFDTSLGVPWTQTLPISTSYDGGWAGTESKSVDVKYNNYNGYVVVAAATDQGLYLFDQAGALIWHYSDESPETIVRISQDGNYIVCVDYNTGFLHYFSHLRDGVPGWGPNDGSPMWSFGGGVDDFYCFWTAISGLGDYVAVSVYPNPVVQGPATAGVILLDNTGSIVWFYILPKGGYVRVDMPCNGKSVVSVNDDPSDALGCDLNYWSDMTDGTSGWSAGDVNPAWTYWPGKEFGNPQNPPDDFYPVSISENGQYIATGGVPQNTYLLNNIGLLQQNVGLMPSNIQSVDLTFEGKYGASVDFSGTIWFFNKDTGFMWSRQYTQAPFHCVAVSKIYPCMFPYPDHDVDISNIIRYTTSDGKVKTIVCQGYPACRWINVTLSNDGDFTETAEVGLYAYSSSNNTLVLIGKKTVTIVPGTNPVISMTWNSTNVPFYGNYTLYATIGPVANEIDVYDNQFTDSGLFITGVGDLNTDRKCDMKDISAVAKAFGSNAGDARYHPNLDLNCDGKIDMKDISTVAKKFGAVY